jgi:hypothetical protein
VRSVFYAVWYEIDKRYFKLSKVGFGGDGSYFVTAPYHPLDTALLGKMRVNYAAKKPVALREAIDQALELAVLDDDKNRLKLSHHPDGFLQFSGHGIVSGRHTTGVPKGIGVGSWRLNSPTFGPSFGVTFHRPEVLGREGLPDPEDIVFVASSLDHMRPSGGGFRDLRFAGHYFPTRFRSFVQRTEAGYRMNIVNPESHVVLELKVALASLQSRMPGLIGLTAEPHELGYEGFVLTSSTGALRRNVKGELIGDQLFCLYPRPADIPNVEFPSINYNLPAPAYEATPGSAVVPRKASARGDRTSSQSRRKRKRKR